MYIVLDEQCGTILMSTCSPLQGVDNPSWYRKQHLLHYNVTIILFNRIYVLPHVCSNYRSAYWVLNAYVVRTCTVYHSTLYNASPGPDWCSVPERECADEEDDKDCHISQLKVIVVIFQINFKTLGCHFHCFYICISKSTVAKGPR